MLRSAISGDPRLDAAMIEQWLAAGWLLPHREGAGDQFDEVDLARARLIRDLHDLGANDESIPIILDLLDQLHGLRRALREILFKAQARQRDLSAS